VLFSHHGGVANVSTGMPVLDRTTFNAYSIAKTMTAAAVLQLTTQGKIALDDPIDQYLGHRLQSDSATIRQTLLHTAGFANPNPLSWVHLVDDHETFDCDRFVENLIRNYGRPTSKPGTRYRYSNVGYVFLGELIAKVSGKPYLQFVEESLISRLQLQKNECLAFLIPDAKSHASGALARFGLLNLLLGLFLDRSKLVEANHGRWTLIRNHCVNGPAYGGLIANAEGLARYLQALLGGAGAFPLAIRALLLSVASTPGPARSLGWFSGQLEEEQWFAHAGGGAGYYCEARMYPRIARASVVMLNRAGVRDERFLNRIDRFLIC
jgi:CubicO group peptidase (beta-lactamase class C family)